MFRAAARLGVSTLGDPGTCAKFNFEAERPWLRDVGSFRNPGIHRQAVCRASLFNAAFGSDDPSRDAESNRCTAAGSSFYRGICGVDLGHNEWHLNSDCRYYRF